MLQLTSMTGQKQLRASGNAAFPVDSSPLPWFYCCSHNHCLFLESLFGGSSRGAQLLLYPWPKTGPPLSGMVVLFDRARSFGRDAHGAVWEEGDTRLASQISRINPGDQWGDRCRNQIALTSHCLFLFLSESGEDDADRTVVAEIMRRCFVPAFVTTIPWEGFHFAGHEIRINEATDCYGAVVWPSV